MKRILLLLFSLITTAAIGQYPINQILSSDSTMVSVGRNATGGIRGGLVNMVFADTTAANLSRISYYTGAQIWTTTDSAIWVRFKGTPSFWVKMAGASGGTTGSFWNITGNYFGGGVPLNYGVGTNSYDYLPLKTNNITRLLIPPDGILRSSAPANKYLMMDTTTLEMYYGDGGGGSGWSLTGNAGTTSSNFIGTTDDQPLSFRVNNTWAGRIYTDGSIFMGGNAGVNNIGILNAGFGQSALQNNTYGVGNTGSGVNSLGNNSIGSYNTGSGLNSLGNNSIGSYNTGIGLNSLKEIVVGGFNTGIGANVGNNAKQKVDAVHQILIGAGTYGTRDSISVIGANFIKETIVRGKLIDSTLSAGAGTKAVRWNSSTGEFTYADTSEVTTPTWQQTLTAGSTLTGNNTIDGGGFDFSFGDSRQFAVATTGASSYFYADASDAGKISLIRIRPDSIVIQPNLGQINIDTLQTASSQNTLIGWTSTSGANRGKVGAVSIGTGLSLSSGTLNSVWTASGNDVYNNNSGNVGIGTTSPDSTLTVIGGLRINNGAAQNNYVWTSTGTDGRGTWKAAAGGNSVNLVFGGGSGASADTAVFTTSAIYGSFYNDADTIVVTSMRSVLQGTSPDVTYKVWYNDSLNVEAGATALVTAGSQVTNTTTGTNVTSFDVTKIPPGVWVWVKTSAVTTKPTYFSLTINAKR
jgi:hypothetical protein